MCMNLRSYAGLQEHERLLGFARRSWLCSLPLYLFGALIFFFTSFWLFTFFSWGSFGSLFVAALYAFALWLCFTAYVTWSGTLLMITDERIVFVVRHRRFFVTRHELLMRDIRAIHHRRQGFLDTTFHLGTLVFESGCEDAESITVSHIPFSFSVFSLVDQAHQSFASVHQPSLRTQILAQLKTADEKVLQEVADLLSSLVK